MTQITQNIFIGSLEDAFNDDCIKNVTHIINVAKELHLLNRIGHEYIKYGVNDDDKNENITNILSQCVEWIDNCISNNGKVLIHCLEGC
jgi:protein-tyrosine phosphatase